VPPFIFLLLACVAGFLAGGIPFGYLTGRLVLRDDIRNHGSGNIGATNVGRVLGWNWGGLVLLLDALKGLLPTLGTLQLARSTVPAEWAEHCAVAAGLSAIVGHMYPIYLRLRGGKGVATALGVVVVLAPQAMLLALGFFVVTLVVGRWMALASIVAALAFGISYLILQGGDVWNAATLSLTCFAICVPTLIIWRHRANIGRLLAGTEPVISKRIRPDSEQDPATSTDDPADQ